MVEGGFHGEGIIDFKKPFVAFVKVNLEEEGREEVPGVYLWVKSSAWEGIIGDDSFTDTVWKEIDVGGLWKEKYRSLQKHSSLRLKAHLVLIH
ncbi:hypothetical protein RJT34_16420 [Clitoria ternatea]|uniref:Uncharacterized protein n=1 Tax=Clitoria ternatea TaxID=43366 RepID=A0AAN9PDN4_CLITE